MIKLLDGLIEKINARIRFHINNPELDTDKFEELKSLLAEADNKARFWQICQMKRKRETGGLQVSK